eukprot:TRINITY_DN11068_c0_g1_i1.p1 TRINITY_DN11068_c0_g1~~TRINITY_DN11068_c0_g1_i1.p1  ORF type:complete len:507 (+),score=120.26 TRINITY_DN11068_c0_g1_i1:68-1588(+)
MAGWFQSDPRPAGRRGGSRRTVYASELLSAEAPPDGPAQQQGPGGGSASAGAWERWGDPLSWSQPLPRAAGRQLAHVPAIEENPAAMAVSAPLTRMPAQPSDPFPHAASAPAPPTEVRCRNIVVLGEQHAGKSAFINTYRRAITGHELWAKAPVGRAAQRGTDCFEPYYDQQQERARWVLADSAGRPLRKIEQVEPIYRRMLNGMEWKVDLCRETGPGNWREAREVAENAADHVILVVRATDVVQDRGIWQSLDGGGRFEGKLDRVSGLQSHFRWWEQELGNAPFVVVTHMDRLSGYMLGGSAEKVVKDALGTVVHKNRVFCICNPDDPADITQDTARTLRKLHRDLDSDIFARQGEVLRGRNAKRGPQWRSSSADPAPSPESQEVPAAGASQRGPSPLDHCGETANGGLTDSNGGGSKGPSPCGSPREPCAAPEGGGAPAAAAAESWPPAAPPSCGAAVRCGYSGQTDGPSSTAAASASVAAVRGLLRRGNASSRTPPVAALESR